MFTQQMLNYRLGLANEGRFAVKRRLPVNISNPLPFWNLIQITIW